jgi:hypothetical protein
MKCTLVLRDSKKAFGYQVSKREVLRLDIHVFLSGVK